MTIPIIMLIEILCGRSSGVERNLAKVEVEGSNPFARSKFFYFFHFGFTMDSFRIQKMDFPFLKSAE